MNIILTNFSDRVDNMLMHGSIGAPIGTIAGIIVNNDTGASLIDSSVKGGIGGTIGAVSGGLISNEHLIGPSIGAVIGGSLAAKFARDHSFKDAFKDLYYKLERESNDDSFGSNDVLFSESENANVSIKDQRKVSELTVKRAEIQGERKETQAQLNELNDSRDRISQNTLREKEQIAREQRRTEDEYDWGKPNDLESYLKNNQKEIDRNANNFDAKSSEIKELKEKIENLKEEERKLTDSIKSSNGSSDSGNISDKFAQGVSKSISEFKNIMTGQSKGGVA